LSFTYGGRANLFRDLSVQPYCPDIEHEDGVDSGKYRDIQQQIGTASNSESMRKYRRACGKEDQPGRGDEEERREQPGWKFRPESMTTEDSNQ
jgi:hypothetical protein